MVPTGDIDLAGCASCGFIWNATFDPALVEYSSDYEATQAYSETYTRFLRDQADDFVETHDLRRKTVVEIGCGHGEFLAALCEAGDNTGLGYDPAFSADRAPRINRGSFRVLADAFDANTQLPKADLICCRNTLEHIPDIGAFVKSLRTAIGHDAHPMVFFQVPSWERIADEGAFWDVYYEHCSYFTVESLRLLFACNGFDVLSCERSFGDQYLTLLARPAKTDALEPRGTKTDTPSCANTSDALREQVALWSARFIQSSSGATSTVLWGGGSKAVALLTTCREANSVTAVVDINPHKDGTYLPLSAHRVIAPEKLRSIEPDCIVIMNPIYTGEIRKQLDELQIEASILELGTA
ncbi:class I SAM-dependent methyltransferase [Hyphobacterium sp.]|uniref:class I SAM-dependent methyltransferase n=1 Tax=Hyphobacterium sp. TaxID=2004662 RepID=UPI003B51BE34